jgi:LmbE family N-acetylglucosaminyl deacetylase
MIDRLLRAVYRRLAPEARNSLRTWLILEESDHMPEPITRFDAGSVLVIAPHRDDEVIGCGGVTARHVQAGARVEIAFMTDGRWGDGSLFNRDLPAAVRERRQIELIARRKREARAAATLLGTHALHFLDRTDGALEPDAPAVSMLARLLRQIRPALVYLPFVYDLHRDHWQTNRVFAAAAAQLDTADAAGITVRGYEVWSPLLANRVADISAVMPLKRQALACFASQLRDQDYTCVVEGLNVYRSIGAFGGKGHAEAFHEAPLAGYLRLVRAAMLAHNPLPLHVGAQERS